MTAKRFTINNDRDFKDIVETYELNCINDNDNETFYFIADSIENVQLFIKRLNELHEENEQLKEQNRLLELEDERWTKCSENDEEIINRLREENEQLKTKNNAYIQDIEVFKEENTHLKLENEMLKSFIKSLASPDGKIWLSRGYVYRIDKILNDFNNTKNDDGDVE